MVKHQQPAKCQAGFTLVELAIVMIIIGLLIGGVLKGQQLITNAQITAQVAQIKAIDAATTSFRDQYAGMAGDLLAPQTRLANCLAANNCIAGAPDGDGKVDAAGLQIDFSAIPAGEQLGYWAQLNLAGLLTGINPSAVGTFWGGDYPASKLAGGGLDVGWYGGNACFPNEQGCVNAGAGVVSGHYLAIHGQANTAVGTAASDAFMTANQAARIDTKIDDGVPGTGTVLAGGVAACVAGTAYQESVAGASCTLYVQFQN